VQLTTPVPDSLKPQPEIKSPERPKAKPDDPKDAIPKPETKPLTSNPDILGDGPQIVCKKTLTQTQQESPIKITQENNPFLSSSRVPPIPINQSSVTLPGSNSENLMTHENLRTQPIESVAQNAFMNFYNNDKYAMHNETQEMDTQKQYQQQQIQATTGGMSGLTAMAMQNQGNCIFGAIETVPQLFHQPQIQNPLFSATPNPHPSMTNNNIFSNQTNLFYNNNQNSTSNTFNDPSNTFPNNNNNNNNNPQQSSILNLFPAQTSAHTDYTPGPQALFASQNPFIPAQNRPNYIQSIYPNQASDFGSQFRLQSLPDTRAVNSNSLFTGFAGVNTGNTGNAQP
jgi:hypothetical protein